jgi:hypothetical protein
MHCITFSHNLGQKPTFMDAAQFNDKRTLERALAPLRMGQENTSQPPAAS